MNDTLYRDMKMKLDALGQNRLLSFYDKLSDGERLELLTQIRDMDFSYLDHFKDKDSPQPASLVEPLPAMTLAEIEADGAKRQVIAKSGGFGPETLLCDLRRLIGQEGRRR